MRPSSRTCFIVTLSFAIIVALSLGAGSAPAFAQSESLSRAETDSLTRELEGLRAEVEALKEEVRALRELLLREPRSRARQTPVVAKVSISASPILGNQDAPITLIEFSDYQCPFCKSFFQATLPALKSTYIDTGKVPEQDEGISKAGNRWVRSMAVEIASSVVAAVSAR